MAPKTKHYFFAELGKMMNMIRSITAELNEEMGIDKGTKAALYSIWYARDYSIALLQSNLQQLESDIAYFFTDSGSRKAMDNRVNLQSLRHKFVEEFRALTSEYFNIKADSTATSSTHDHRETATKAAAFKVDALAIPLMN